jgi:hypothetical protein
MVYLLPLLMAIIFLIPILWKHKSLRIFMLAGMNIILVLSIIFRYYIEKELWFWGLLIPLFLLVITILVDLISAIKSKNKLTFMILLVPLFSIMLLYFNIGY